MADRSGKYGWFLGMILGTMFGVLFAPQKGKDLRSKIKADRKKGKLGIAPLKDDFKILGKEVADLAKDLYESDAVKDLVEMGRKKMHHMSDDWVSDIHDFHKSRIMPFQKEMMEHIENMKKSVTTGKKTAQKATGEWKDLQGKLKKSAKIGKKAMKDITGTLKKKGSKK